MAMGHLGASQGGYLQAKYSSPLEIYTAMQLQDVRIPSFSIHLLQMNALPFAPPE